MKKMRHMKRNALVALVLGLALFKKSQDRFVLYI